MPKNITIDFMPPGMLEFSVLEVAETTEPTGYAPIGLDDLQADCDLKTGEPLAYIAYNFHQNFFSILRALDGVELPYRYNLPQANLTDLSLRQLLTWLYAHYVLEQQQPMRMVA